MDLNHFKIKLDQFFCQDLRSISFDVKLIQINLIVFSIFSSYIFFHNKIDLKFNLHIFKAKIDRNPVLSVRVRV